MKMGVPTGVINDFDSVATDIHKSSALQGLRLIRELDNGPDPKCIFLRR